MGKKPATPICLRQWTGYSTSLQLHSSSTLATCKRDVSAEMSTVMMPFMTLVEGEARIKSLILRMLSRFAIRDDFPEPGRPTKTRFAIRRMTIPLSLACFSMLSTNATDTIMYKTHIISMFRCLLCINI